MSGFHHPRTKTPLLRPGGINLFPHHFLGQYRTTLAVEVQQSQAGKNFKTDSKRAAVELWRAGVPLDTIRKQLKMSESTLRRILAVVRKNPTLPAEEVHGLPAERGGGAADKVSGGNCQGGWHDQILN